MPDPFTIQASRSAVLAPYLFGIPRSLSVNPQETFPFRTFRSSGTQIQGIVTFGVFRRF